MIISLKIPDELYALYAERNPSSPQGELEKALLDFKDLTPGDRRVILEGDTLQEISRLIGHPISTSRELLEHLTRSQRVSLPEEGIELELNIGQRARLKSQAEFFKQDFKDFVKKQLAAGVIAIVGP